MKTQEVHTQLMIGYKDIEGVIYNLLCDTYGCVSVFESNFDTDNAIYSANFISAIENGLIPELELVDNSVKREQEYHHVLINGECFRAYFN